MFPASIDRRNNLGTSDRFDVYCGMADSRIDVARLDLPVACRQEQMPIHLKQRCKDLYRRLPSPKSFHLCILAQLFAYFFGKMSVRGVTVLLSAPGRNQAGSFEIYSTLSSAVRKGSFQGGYMLNPDKSHNTQ
ncbi:MAG: hypothetical protein ABSG60_07195 [Terracidiphilus sp.]